eukprot:1668462-Rhodomonas_salina.1
MSRRNETREAAARPARPHREARDAGSEEDGGRTALPRVKREEKWTRVFVTLRMGGEKRRQ